MSSVRVGARISASASVRVRERARVRVQVQAKAKAKAKEGATRPCPERKLRRPPRAANHPYGDREHACVRAGSPWQDLGTSRSRSPPEDRSEQNSARPSARFGSGRDGREAYPAKHGGELNPMAERPLRFRSRWVARRTRRSTKPQWPSADSASGHPRRETVGQGAKENQITDHNSRARRHRPTSSRRSVTLRRWRRCMTPKCCPF